MSSAVSEDKSPSGLFAATQAMRQTRRHAASVPRRRISLFVFGWLGRPTLIRTSDVIDYPEKFLPDKARKQALTLIFAVSIRSSSAAIPNSLSPLRSNSACAIVE